MKFCFTLLVSLMSVSSTFAYDRENIPSGTKIDFQSWCEGDVIHGEDKYGDTYSVFDCYDADKRCTENSTLKGDWTVVTATCS